MCRLAQGFFGRVDDTSDMALFNQVLKLRMKELAAEISIITSKLNFGYEEVKSLTIEERQMYLDRVQELFGDKKQQQANQPISQKERDFLQKNQEKMGKGQKR